MHDVQLYENMVSRTGQEIRLKQYPKGMPTEDIFELVKVDLSLFESLSQLMC
jgi:hypothetical protein